ncbi:MAG: DNA cytosine methyltransferase [Gammaproteobacteria bacterium]|nr:DNA cytosine methyltransferase [Gammaproteobacteria bacterium]MBU1601779.1 DNA cytosine methyltransferase [Gammaproteobacteria bacterium]MBU2432151.1 DNA cytosine methyltransferase [Gammaproteobacteria bacterium]MBU2450456.1 DNA cytosine methyltransferase [Gammaproteobacteria bacterium]
MSIPVIDLFSGPGGLGEGFAGLDDGQVFRILVSAEMNPAAHQTLRLRSYYRHLRASGSGMQAYYDFCRGVSTLPWNSENTRKLWDKASEETLNITLGSSEGDRLLDKAIDERLKPGEDCVLIGGPPCQAYSLVGRSRNRGKADYRPEDDKRHFLYREYLRVLQKTRPAVFVMENVKGILSSRVGNRQIFQDILTDLVNPSAALAMANGTQTTYRIHSLTSTTTFTEDMDIDSIDPFDFVVHAEEHGIPQARHRVILLGVRSDISGRTQPLSPRKKISVLDAIGDLPKLRSKLTRQPDSKEAWAEVVSSHCLDLSRHAIAAGMTTLSAELLQAIPGLLVKVDSGALRIPKPPTRMETSNDLLFRLRDPALPVILNHESRGHMSEDLRRYVFAATFATIEKRSPKGHNEFSLPGLAPKHANWESGNFSDRFRVQVGNRPSTTITSHISKDGHYFIHPDAAQCRSLTVREAARLQTFPDNYFFQGNRTEQFHQVGNAVPPLLAAEIAAKVKRLLS